MALAARQEREEGGEEDAPSSGGGDGGAVRAQTATTSDGATDAPTAAEAGETAAAPASVPPERIPGKYQLDERRRAEQARALDELARAWREERIAREREQRRVFGFCPTAETVNGRMAMFFLVVGLLTELWTHETIPQQVGTLLRLLGFF